MRPNSGDVIGDKYRLERLLGEGGMGTVFAAVNTVTGKQVAIKWLKPELAPEEYVQRFMREAQVASRIEHPNVVNVFDMGRHEGALFLVMEMLHGEPLSAWLEHTVPEPEELLNLMIPVCRGVHAAHRMGVVHRDLKPDNIFLCRDAFGEAREPRVLDFGISKISEGSIAPRQLTREGAVFGTPQYMAPEQLRNVRAADARSDIYALGVILYRALSGRLPYDADTLPALVLQIVEGGALHLSHLCPELDPALAEVVMRAMAPERADRFSSVAELARALEPFASVKFETTSVHAWSSSPGEYERDPSKASRPGRVRTPASHPAPQQTPAGLRQNTPPSMPRGTPPSLRTPADTSRASHPVDTSRPNTQAVPTPVSGLRTHSSRSRAMWLGAGAMLLALPLVGAWLHYGSEGAKSQGEAGRETRTVPQPPAPPVGAGLEPRAAPLAAPQAPLPVAPESTPSAPALAGGPGGDELTPGRESSLADAGAPSAEAERKRPRRARPEAAPSADQARTQPTASAPVAEPREPAPAPVQPIAAPVAEPRPAEERRDPTLRTDGNPYLRRR